MSLKDELFKAKLITKKDIKRLEHEERVEEKKLGREGMKEKRKEEWEAIEEKQRKKKQKDMEINQANNQEQKEKEKQHRIEQILKTSRITDGISGNRKFYFVACSGKIPYLSVGEDMVKKLETGNAAIIQTEPSDNCEFVIVSKSGAEQLLQLCPELVRFFQK